MKINIVYKFKKGPWGGGNQFLKALKNEFIKRGLYIKIPEKAEIILFNSHHCLEQIISLKLKYPNKIFIHRVDGPISLIRNKDFYLDKVVFKINCEIADATIFQSNWSKLKCYFLGLKRNNFEKIIINAPNSLIFNREGKNSFNRNRKIRLIATSWSQNWNKGFDVYKWLDENLDFSRYEMTFIGNSPIDFKNIKWIKPLLSEELALQLKQYDIYITASKNDPCSNALLEALSCGLPVIALNDGGHPEIVKIAGELFNNKEEIPQLIEKIVLNYMKYASNIKLQTINEVAQQYYEFIKKIYNKVKNNEYFPKKLNYLKYLKIKILIFLWKIQKFKFKNSFYNFSYIFIINSKNKLKIIFQRVILFRVLGKILIKKFKRLKLLLFNKFEK